MVKSMKYDELFLDEKDLKKYKVKKIISSILLYTFLTLVALFILIPFYWMFATALRTTEEMAQPTIGFFPETWAFENFVKVLKEFEPAGTGTKIGSDYFGRFFLNTIIVAVLTTAFAMISTILSAFAFARLNFKGRETIFSLMLATMMIPGEIYVITNYMTVSSFSSPDFMGGIMQWAGVVSAPFNNPTSDPDKFNLYHYGALILPFIVSVFYIFFLRQTFKQIPNELYLAAKVDGTGDFKYLIKVMIPIAKATIISILILSMMGTWNAYVWPNLVIRADEAKLISDGLLATFTNESADYANYRMAAASLVTVPLLVVFICLKKYIMRGVSRSGIKG